MRSWRVLVLCGILIFCGLAAWGQTKSWEAYLTPYEKENLAKNRQFVAQRRAHGESSQAKVGVFVDAGVWNQGAVALVQALESSGMPCRVLTGDDLGQLESLRGLIIPGGYAGNQWMALGDSGGPTIRAFVERGGHLLGVCAGGYLISKTVRYQSTEYPFPLGLFDGVAEGPIAGLPDYPSFGPVKVTPTASGIARGLAAATKRAAVYGGGPRFTGGTGVTVLLCYPDGSAAAVRRSLGKGEVVAMGVHVEVTTLPDGGLGPSPPRGSGALLKAILGI